MLCEKRKTQIFGVEMKKNNLFWGFQRKRLEFNCVESCLRLKLWCIYSRTVSPAPTNNNIYLMQYYFFFFDLPMHKTNTKIHIKCII